MDYHFLKPKFDRATQSSGDVKNISKIVKNFLPVFVLAAMLPFFIGFVVAPPDIDFFTRADSASSLRVWLEPSNIVMSSGSQTTLTVVASFESETKLIPEISFDVVGSESLAISNSKIVYSIPFSGRVELGEVTVSAAESGKAEVIIPEDSIVVNAFDGPLEITSGSTNIVVR